MSIEINDEITRNFHLFWDNYPGPVMLVHKTRTIMAANRAARALSCPVGTRCIDLGEKKHHAGCLASKALKEGTGVREVSYAEHLGQVVDGYWIPLAGSEELYVHFCNDITDYASERLFTPKCGETGRECGSCPV